MSKTSDLKQKCSELKSLLSGQCRLNFKGNRQKQSENKRKNGFTAQLTHLLNERYSRKKGLSNLIDEIFDEAIKTISSIILLLKIMKSCFLDY